MKVYIIYAPVVQWIGHNPAKIVTQVRLLVGAKTKRLFLTIFYFMKKVLKRLGIFLLSLLILFLGGIVFSFLFPKVLSPLDSTRLFFQSKLLRFAGETILGDMVINED